jgi:REP element-mobilizing transposase RayT
VPVKPNFNSDYFYFVTTAAVRHFHLFHQDVIKRIIVDSFHYLRVTRKMKLFVFVVMPNHIHIIVRFSEEYPLSDVMRDFKKFTARNIFRQFSDAGNSKVLDLLRKEGKRVKQAYKVWEDSYDARDIFSIKFLQQKMNYIHHNPCQQHWNLVEAPEQYLWSTAGFYLDEKPCVIPIDDAREYL